MSPNAELPTIEETSAKLHVDLDTVRRLLRQKKLPGVKINAQWSVSAAALNVYSEGIEPAEKARE
jgi:excisionase family DNA binding protein